MERALHHHGLTPLSCLGRNESVMNIQDVVDGLAHSLQRSVLINDRAYRPLAASRQVSDTAGAHLHQLLQGPSRAQTRESLTQMGVIEAKQAMKVNLSAAHGREQLAVPIRDAEQPLGTLWLATGGLPTLTPTDYSSINAAVTISREILTPRAASGSTEQSSAAVAADLLHDDVATRSRSFAAAVSQRWLTRGERTLVWAVDVASSNAIERMALGRHFTMAQTPGLCFLADRGGCLVFVSSGRERAGVESEIRAEAGRRIVSIRAIGSARHDRGDDDLVNAAQNARSAATLVQYLPEPRDSADISELGAWLLLSSVVADRAQLSLFSPAAYALCIDGDVLQRETVETYLDVCGQVRDACQRLHVHRTTLYYRLDRLPEVVRDALADGMNRSTLHLCLKLIRYWEAMGRL